MTEFISGQNRIINYNEFYKSEVKSRGNGYIYSYKSITDHAI